MAKTPETDAGTPSTEDGTGKGRATPSRKQQEAARKQPLVPSDRKGASRASRDSIAAARERARVGMANGEEKYLPARDKGPQRRYVRDYVDARFSLGEIILPFVVVVFAATFLPAGMAEITYFAIWGVFLIVIIDCIVLGFTVTRKIAAKFGKDKVERGLRWYAAMRAIQLRPIRLPKPQVKRFQFPS